MKRNCGECTACCKTHGVFEMQKMSGDWCPQCEIGKGCKIYSQRPKECQTFKCAWLLGIAAPHHRPDKTGIVPDYRELPGIGKVMWFFEFSAGSLNSDFTRRWTLRNLLVGNCVMQVSVDKNYTLYLPKGLDCSHQSFVSESSGKEAEMITFPESVSRFVYM
jgi:hypothetical protein